MCIQLRQGVSLLAKVWCGPGLVFQPVHWQPSVWHAEYTANLINFLYVGHSQTCCFLVRTPRIGRNFGDESLLWGVGASSTDPTPAISLTFLPENSVITRLLTNQGLIIQLNHFNKIKIKKIRLKRNFNFGHSFHINTPPYLNLLRKILRKWI